jgi:hypothetical protein
MASRVVRSGQDEIIVGGGDVERSAHNVAAVCLTDDELLGYLELAHVKRRLKHCGGLQRDGCNSGAEGGVIGRISGGDSGKV